MFTVVFPVFQYCQYIVNTPKAVSVEETSRKTTRNSLRRGSDVPKSAIEKEKVSGVQLHKKQNQTNKILSRLHRL